MSSPTHTPGPWIAEQNMIRQPNGSKRRRIVCPPDHDGMQDAAFIVRACNAHEELVKALKASLLAIPDGMLSTNQAHIVQQIRHAIAKAEGKE